MVLDIFVPVVITAAIQSIFGVGVLLFGTPILLLVGYDFITALTVLLPISVSINLIQIAMHRAHVDWALYRKILVYTIPFVVACLVLITETKVDIGIAIGLFLLFVAAKDFSPRVNEMVESLLRYERTYLVVMGIVHGLTNLGGSLLTALTHSKNYDKDTTRVTTAIAYCTFAIFQIATLLLTARHLRIDYAAGAGYVVTGIIVYAIVDRLWYVKLDDTRYRRLFSVFLFASGCLLIYKWVAHAAAGKD